MATSAAPKHSVAPKAPKKASMAVVTKPVKKPIETKTYVAIVAVVTALIVIACGFAADKLIGSDIIDVKVIVGDSTAKSDLKTKLDNAPKVISAYKDLGTQQQLIADAVPNTPDFPQLVALMDSISALSGVQLKSIAPTDTTTGAAPTGTTAAAPAAASSSTSTPYGITVEIEGPYPQIVSYFHNVELSARQLRVQSATFQGNSSDLQATIGIQTYYQGKADITDKSEAVK